MLKKEVLEASGQSRGLLEVRTPPAQDLSRLCLSFRHARDRSSRRRVALLVDASDEDSASTSSALAEREFFERYVLPGFSGRVDWDRLRG